MRALFQCKKYEVLSMEGLRYETSFDRVYSGTNNTHVPVFKRDIELFVQVGNEVRRFVPICIWYAFRYYNNENVLSAPFTAVICELEGESSECVILGRYAQSAADDYWDSLSPFEDVPSGRWDFWQEVPGIFFSDRERTSRKPYTLRRVCIPGCNHRYDKEGNDLLCAYQFNPEKESVALVQIEIQELVFDPYGQASIKCKSIDEGEAFWTMRECEQWCKDNYNVL